MFIGEIQRREDSFIFEVASKELRNWISTPRTPLCRLKMKTFLSVKGGWRAAASGRVAWYSLCSHYTLPRTVLKFGFIDVNILGDDG